ncbi:MAG: hypothetical protein JNL98_30105 [Bryobacterales bacterium]|nr:hypothetical protein [Bryobacterales bacterium]
MVSIASIALTVKPFNGCFPVPSGLYLYADTGERRPLRATGLGKAILAWQPSELVNRIAGRKLKRFTKHTLCSASDLKEDLRKIRERGYAIVHVLSNRAIDGAAAQIREAAMKISVQVGFRPASSNMLSLISG